MINKLLYMDMQKDGKIGSNLMISISTEMM